MRPVGDRRKHIAPKTLAFPRAHRLLSLAMGLRNQAISNREFRFKATRLKTQIVHTVRSPATHLGIQRIQDIFQEQAERIYHWAESR